MVTTELPVAPVTLTGVTAIQFFPDGFAVTEEVTVKVNGWPAVVATVRFCEAAALFVPPI
jgi:hypothetical protein